jgi:cytoskeletal protein CcmA (bactofilin family)
MRRDNKPRPNAPEPLGSRRIPSAFPKPYEAMRDAALKTSGLLAAGQTVAALGRSLAVRGALSGNEDLLIEGQFDGTIDVQGRCLTVASGAQVKANIQARRADIHGSLSGSVSASEKIEVRKTAHVTGDLVTAGVLIEDGASFKGSIEIVREGTAEEQGASSSSAGKEGA